ncbi:hypothetical protein D1872_310070 [compost metagenome]
MDYRYHSLTDKQAAVFGDAGFDTLQQRNSLYPEVSFELFQPGRVQHHFQPFAQFVQFVLNAAGGLVFHILQRELNDG